MGRGRKSRDWVKIDCNGVLHGSINYLLELDEQAVWFKTIAFAEVCGGPSGFIQDNEGNGLPHEYIAHELHCPVEVFESMLDKMSKDNAVRVNGTGAIELVNFLTYQFTEYDRQKPYRDAKKTSQDSSKYTEGRYGNNVCQSRKDVEKVLKERKSGKGGSP